MMVFSGGIVLGFTLLNTFKTVITICKLQFGHRNGVAFNFPAFALQAGYFAFSIIEVFLKHRPQKHFTSVLFTFPYCSVLVVNVT